MRETAQSATASSTAGELSRSSLRWAARAVQRRFCAQVGNHITCDVGEAIYAAALDALTELAATGEGSGVWLSTFAGLGADGECPELICYAEGPRGQLCDRRRAHSGWHVDIFGPGPGNTWPNDVVSSTKPPPDTSWLVTPEVREGDARRATKR